MKKKVYMKRKSYTKNKRDYKKLEMNKKECV